MEQSFPEGLYPVERSYFGAGDQYEEEEEAKMKCYEVPYPLCTTRREGGTRVGNEGVKLTL